MEALNNYSMSFDDNEKRMYRAQVIQNLESMNGQDLMEFINLISWTPSIEIFRSIIYNILYNKLTKNYFRIIPAQYVEIRAYEFDDGYVQSSELSEEIKEVMWDGIIDGSTRFQTTDPNIIALITGLQIIGD